MVLRNDISHTLKKLDSVKLISLGSGEKDIGKYHVQGLTWREALSFLKTIQKCLSIIHVLKL